MEKGFEVDPDGRVGFRLLSRRGIFLQFRLINVAPGQVPSPAMLYITFQFKGPYILMRCVFWNKLLTEKNLFISG